MISLPNSSIVSISSRNTTQISLLFSFSTFSLLTFPSSSTLLLFSNSVVLSCPTSILCSSGNVPTLTSISPPYLPPWKKNTGSKSTATATSTFVSDNGLPPRISTCPQKPPPLREMQG